MRFPRAILTDVAATDRASLSITPAIRVAVLVVVAMIGGRWLGHPASGTSAAVGSLFIGLSDPSGAYRHRIRGLSGAVALTSLAVALGVLVANDPVLHVAVVTLWAFGSGLLCALGPRGAMAGVLSLVVVVVYSGAPMPVDSGGGLVVALVAGEVVMVAAIVLPWIWHRASGSRAQLAVFFRGEAVALRCGPEAMWSTVHAERLRMAGVGLDADLHEGASRQWFSDLMVSSQSFRTSVAALAEVLARVGTGEERDALVEVVSAVSNLSRGVARTLVWPTRHRGLGRAQTRLTNAVDHYLSLAGPSDSTVVLAVVSAIDGAVALVGGPWPLGRRFGVRVWGPLRSTGFSWRDHLRWSDPSFRHGVRLTIAIFVAIMSTLVVHFPHDYWIAVTVAWIAKPGAGDTYLKVASRLAGTCLGALLTLLVFVVFRPDAAWSLVLLGFAAVVTVFFLVPNYAWCIAGFTMFVLVAFWLQGDPVDSTAPARMLATLIGGIIVLLASLLWPFRQKYNVRASLADVALALADVVEPMINQPGVNLLSTKESRVATDARARATTVLAIAAHEPGHHVLHFEDARQILQGFNELAAQLVEVSILPGGRPGVGELREIQTGLRDVAVRLENLGTSREGTEPGEPGTSLLDPLDRAHRLMASYH